MAEITIIGEIGVLVAASRKAKSAADSGKYKEAIEQLRIVNTQGRKLEWRGGKVGLRHLPKLEEVKPLKEQISSIRAAVQEAITAVQNMNSLAKKEGKKPAEVAAINKKESVYKGTAGKIISMMISTAIKAEETAKAQPWVDPKILLKPENKEFLIMLLNGSDYYTDMDETIRKPFLGRLYKINLERANLKEAILEGANLKEAGLWGAILEGANLQKAILVGANLKEANLEGANLEGANLQGAGLLGADLFKANLEGANLKEANLFMANLESVEHLTEEQLHSTKNWQRAINIPKELL